MMDPRSRLVAFAIVAACSDSGGGSASQGSTGAITSASATVVSTGEASDSATPTTSEGSASGTGSSTGGGGIKYDLGVETGDTGPIGTACQMAEMARANTGCLFWAVDLPNAWQVSLSPAPEEQTYAIVAANTGGETAAVRVFAGADGTPLQTANIGDGQIHVFKFDNTYGTKNRQNSLGLAYRVESDQPITLYQFNPLDNSTEVFSNDASLLFPVHALDRDYTAVTGDGIRLLGPGGDFNAGAFVTVVATENDTVIDLYPPKGVPLYPGATGVQIDAGQTYTLMSNAVLSLLQNNAGQGNLSGTRVAADKPVAVFSGNVASFEPTPQMGCCADHLEHQMLPLSAWGSRYAVVLAPPNNDEGGEDKVRVRITGSFDGTKLSYSPAAPPGAPPSINAYQTATFVADASFLVSADQNFAVTQFLLSNEVITDDPTPDDDADNGFWPGDPAMILVPATAQYQSRYVFLVPAEYARNAVTIVRPAGAKVTLDGVDVSATGDWGPVGSGDGVAYERAHFVLKSGAHSVEAGDDAKVGITVVGYDVAVSFGYAGGSGAAFIGAAPVPPPQ